MSTVFAMIGWTLFGIAMLAGIALDVVGLFGNWIILAAAVIAWALTGFEHFGPWSLGILATLAVVGEVVETALAGYGAKKFGGSRGAMFAALAGCLLGALVGTPWFPPLGTLAGACLGSFVAATIYELTLQQKDPGEALWTGLGAALGKVGGLIGKLVTGLIMLVVIFASF